jgi:hypothetical protein
VVVLVGDVVEGEVMALRPLQRRLVKVSFLLLVLVFAMDSGLLFCMPLHGCRGWGL